MQLMTLNIWGGHVRDPLLKFISTHQSVDIFCLQEVYHNAPQKISAEDRRMSLNIFSELQALLPHHQALFQPIVGNHYGIGMLIKNTTTLLAQGEVEIYTNPSYPGIGPTHSRSLQWARCQTNGQHFSILNVHGLWNGKGKTDSPERIVQSQKIRSFMDTLKNPKIVCGDFNLRPDTESLKILEHGMHNLIQTHNILSTRTSLYTKEEKFADYILTSPEVAVHQFKVLEDEVSDHSPLLLEFGL
jgi:endonuclease/exonuclease/phosphatase family metal-dependent hydrolase